jgi:hypothetical protein
MEVVKSRISGAWKWNEIIKFSFQGTEKIKFFFQKNHTIFPADAMTINHTANGNFVAVSYNENNGIAEEVCNAAFGWTGEGYDDSAIFYFGEELQEITTDLYAYILDNATPVEWSDYAQWLGEGEWHWKDTLTIPNNVLGYNNVVVANTEHRKAVFVAESDVLSGAFGNQGCFYISGSGWLDGGLSVEDILNGIPPTQSDNLQTWRFNGGYVSILAYEYLYLNAIKEKDLLIKERTLKDIASAIRTKTGKIAQIPGAKMPEEILSIPQSGEIRPVNLQKKSAVPSLLNQKIKPDERYDGLSEVDIAGIQAEEKTFTENGEYTPTNGRFYSKVKVDVPAPTISLQDKEVTPTAIAQEIKADSNYDGLNKVTVKATPTEEKTFTENGVYSPTAGKFYSKVKVDVPASQPKLQKKSAKPSAEAQTISPDKGYVGLSEVEIDAVSLQEKLASPKIYNNQVVTTREIVSPDSGYVGLKSVKIAPVCLQGISTSPSTQEKTIRPASGYQGLSQVHINPIQVSSLICNKNGEYTPKAGEFFSEVFVDVPSEAPTLQDKEVVTKNLVETIEADGTFDGLRCVTVTFDYNVYDGTAFIEE